MKLKVKILDIAKKGVLLHTADARQIGVLDGDRVQVSQDAIGQSVSAMVDTTSTLIEPGSIGLYRLTCVHACPAEGAEIEVRESVRPLSIEFIKKKMNGERLLKEETAQIVKDVVEDILSPIEISAYITASYIQGMDMDEVEQLTRSMVDTGDRLQFTSHPIVDKHSIGGVPGNKITLLVVPIIAASGLKIPKTSSRAITGAGGTADLMEVLAPVNFTALEVQEMTMRVGGAIVWGGATNIAPADDKFIKVEYPFRIDARGQMLASVMAKKKAVGADLVVIDIPVGQNTKVLNVQEGRKLARDFIDLGERLGMRVECALTYGESPVGHSIGPNLEVREALSILEGSEEPTSLVQKSLSIAGMLLEMSGKAPRGGGYDAAEKVLRSGKALDKFRQIIETQGGDQKVKSEEVVPGSHQFVVNAPIDGYVSELNNKALITIARAAGAPQDRAAGIYIHAKKGMKVEKGEPILTIFAEREWRLQKAVEIGRTLMPLVVEGMLLDRIPSEHWS